MLSHLNMIAYGKKINDLASLDVQNFFKNAEYYTFEFEIKKYSTTPFCLYIEISFMSY